MFGSFRPRVELKSPEELALMRRAGLILDRTHEAIQSAVAPGVTTRQLDEVAAATIAEAGARPNFLGYQGFPATICVSVNDEIVHGIPGPRVLEAGDVVSVDAGCIVEGWHSDAARTHIVGKPSSDEDAQLVEVTRGALWAGIAELSRAKRVGEIGAAIEDFVSDAVGERFQHLEDFGGHGIGSAMHQPPDVMNFRTRDKGPKIVPGMVLAIEPMLVIGNADYEVLGDDWTVVASSGARSAHWEHSVAITDGGIFVLSAADGGKRELAARGIAIADEPV